MTKVDITVPQMGESITEATIGEILKPDGSQVATDDEILELETDKVNQVLYAPEGGQITLSVSSGDVVTIGQVIGHVDSSAKGKEEKSPEKKEEPQEKEPEAEKSPPQEGNGARVSKEAFVEEVKTPKEEKAPAPNMPARESPAPKPRPAPSAERETRKKMSRIRQVIAKRLVEVQQETAMLTTFNEVDMSTVMEMRAKHKEAFFEEHGVKLGFMSFFVKAVVSALQEFPEINAYIDGEDVVYRHYYDISIAVGTEKGLIVPVVRNCDQLSFAAIEEGIASLAKRARDGALTVDDLQGGCFTITNGGIYGSMLSTPILNAPQSGILGMHAIQKRAVVIDDQIVIRPMMYLALSYDHRIVDGKEAVSFLVHVKNTLEDPSRILLDL